MVHARDDPSNRGYHPFWYARVIGIFHVNVQYRDRLSYNDWETVHFLWVRWFGRSEPANIRVSQPVNQHRLDWVGFVTEKDDTDPFGFLDPADVIRSCHLIPAFNDGQTNELMGPSIARISGDSDSDWKYYYINRFCALLINLLNTNFMFRFVDRDMLMLFMGGGVGHSSHSKKSSLHPTEPGSLEEDGGTGVELERESESGNESEDESDDESEDESDTENADMRDDSEVDDVNISDDGYGSA
jgi:hypothetical protein